jgi:hypothetical protein
MRRVVLSRTEDGAQRLVGSGLGSRVSLSLAEVAAVQQRYAS